MMELKTGGEDWRRRNNIHLLRTSDLELGVRIFQPWRPFAPSPRHQPHSKLQIRPELPKTEHYEQLHRSLSHPRTARILTGKDWGRRTNKKRKKNNDGVTDGKTSHRPPNHPTRSRLSSVFVFCREREREERVPWYNLYILLIYIYIYTKTFITVCYLSSLSFWFWIPFPSWSICYIFILFRNWFNFYIE